MPQGPDFTKYLDAGAEFVALTRAQARDRAHELVAQGQLAQSQVQTFVDGLVDESRRRTDQMMDVVRQEIQRQMQAVGIATKADLARLEARLEKQAKSGTKKSGGKSASSGKSGTKKSGTKKSGTKKSGMKTSGTKKSGTKKSGTKAAKSAAAAS